MTTEHSVDDGLIDFRVGGTNPSVIELAVAPRQIGDLIRPTTVFPGHAAATQLYASQNRTEIVKLNAIPFSQAKTRYMLLLDFRGFDSDVLFSKYENLANSVGISNPVAVVHVSHSGSKKRTLRRRTAQQ